MFQNERSDKEEQRLYSETYNHSPAAFATFTQYVRRLINHPLLLYNARFVFFFLFFSFFTSTTLNLVVVSSEACDKFCSCIFSIFKVKTAFYL